MQRLGDILSWKGAEKEAMFLTFPLTVRQLISHLNPYAYTTFMAAI